MKTHGFIFSHCLLGLALLIAPLGLCASPLTWFPGPPLDEPVSGAATVVNHGANLLIGGDSFSVRQLAATNSYWTWTPAPGPAQNPLYSPITSYTIMERNVSVSPARECSHCHKYHRHQRHHHRPYPGPLTYLVCVRR